jgi:hypothetical protein
MASLGKKILSAFMELEEGKKAAAPRTSAEPENVPAPDRVIAAGDQRFAEYFDRLFGEANIPGPDYYEFARMITAMRAISDERARYVAAFAGLQVQGLDKEKLLSTAGEYLRVLTADAAQFGNTVDTALQEKVHGKTAEAEEKSKRIQALSQEILDLQAQIGAMQNEIAEARSRLEANNSAYGAESQRRMRQIQTDIEKINTYIH